MDQISELIKSPVFWFASVFMAFLISLFSNFAKDWFQRLWASHSVKKKQKLDIQNTERARKIETLKNDHQLLAVYHSNIVYQKLREILYLIVEYVTLLFATSNFINGSLYTALIFMVFFFLMHVVTMPISRKLKEMRAVLNGTLESEDVFFSG